MIAAWLLFLFAGFAAVLLAVLAAAGVLTVSLKRPTGAQRRQWRDGGKG